MYKYCFRIQNKHIDQESVKLLSVVLRWQEGMCHVPCVMCILFPTHSLNTIKSDYSQPVQLFINKEVKILKRLCSLQQTGSNLVQEAPQYH